MVLKICYKHQIHRISKLPASFKTLLDIVSTLFSGQLPERWTLQYIDSDGDTVMLSDDSDFKNLLDEELGGSGKSIKVHVISLDDLTQSQIRSIADSSTNIQSDDFHVIEKQEPVLVESPVMEELSLPIKEITFEEKPEEPKEPVVETSGEPAKVPISEPIETPDAPEVSESAPSRDQETETVDVQEVEQPKEEAQPVPEQRCGRHRSYRKRHSKKTLKKLARSDLTEAKKEKLEAKLREIEENMEPEEREAFLTKKAKLAVKFVKKEAKKKAQLFDTMTDIIYTQLPAIASLTKDLIKGEVAPKPEEPKKQEEPKPTGQAIHHRIYCDGCNQHPITGIRYKCLVCPDFDYCETCEASIEHAHAFIKMRKPQPFWNEQPQHGQCTRRRWEAPRNPEPSEQPKPQAPAQPQVQPQPEAQPQAQPQDSGSCPFSNINSFSGFANMGNMMGGQVNEKLAPLFKAFNDFKKTDSFKSLMGSFFFGQSNPSNKDKIIADVMNCFTSLPENCRDLAAQHYKGLPQQLKQKINSILFNLPEDLFGEKKEEAKVEEPAPVEEIKKNKVVPEENLKKPAQSQEKEYPEEVKQKGLQLLAIFEDAKLENLFEFVSQVPNMSIEELVDNYLSQ